MTLTTAMDQRTFAKLRDIVYAESGISLSPAKRALLMARTAKRLRALGLADFKEYAKVLEADETGDELVEFLDAVSTNVTSFFREPAHFDVVRNYVDEAIRRGRIRLRAWSAGCASGEEAYSLGMTILDAAHERTLDARILATDINTHTLEVARLGRYSADKVRTVPVQLRQRYMHQEGMRERPSWTVNEDLHRMVTFKRLNLAQPPFTVTGPLDLVFCRNVMIYFDQKVREHLLSELHRVLRPGGLLVVGHSESLAARSGLFSLLYPSVLVRS